LEPLLKLLLDRLLRLPGATASDIGRQKAISAKELLEGWLHLEILSPRLI
jgi:hypothetical protein